MRSRAASVRSNSGNRKNDRTRRRRPAEADRHGFGLEPLEQRLLLANWSGSLPDGTIWTNTEVQRIVGDVTLPAGRTLTIDPGTVIKVDAGRYLQIFGTMDARGTATMPITFTSFRDDTVAGDTNGDGASTGLRGDWEAIYFFSGSDASRLENAEVRFAGNTFQPGNGCCFVASIHINDSDGNAASVTLTDVRVTNADDHGVGIYGGAPTLTRVSVDGARRAAFEGNLETSPTLSMLAAANSGTNGYEINPGTLSTNRTWDFGGLPGVLESNVAVGSGATLNIVPSQVIKVSAGAYFQSFGTQNARRTANSPIIFTSYRDDTVAGDTNGDGPSTGVPGDWEAIYFQAGSDASVLENAQVRFAGNTFQPGNGCCFVGSIFIDDADGNAASVSLTNVQVLDADSTGVFIQNGSPTLTNVSVSRACQDAFRATLSANTIASNLTAADTGGDHYLVDAGKANS